MPRLITNDDEYLIPGRDHLIQAVEPGPAFHTIENARNSRIRGPAILLRYHGFEPRQNCPE